MNIKKKLNLTPKELSEFNNSILNSIREYNKKNKNNINNTEDIFNYWIKTLNVPWIKNRLNKNDFHFIVSVYLFIDNNKESERFFF